MIKLESLAAQLLQLLGYRLGKRPIRFRFVVATYIFLCAIVRTGFGTRLASVATGGGFHVCK